MLEWKDPENEIPDFSRTVLAKARFGFDSRHTVQQATCEEDDGFVYWKAPDASIHDVKAWAYFNAPEF